MISILKKTLNSPGSLQELYSGAICDALDELEVDYITLIFPNIYLPKGPVFGPVFTCKGKDFASHSLSDSKFEEIDRIRIEMLKGLPKGTILFLEANSKKELAHFGDIGALAAKTNNVQGVVLDGLTRDIDLIKKMKFPILYKGLSPINSGKEWAIVEYKKSIQIQGKKISPWDVAFIDETGCVLFSWKFSQTVLLKAKQIASNEEKMRREIKKKRKLIDIYDERGRW